MPIVASREISSEKEEFVVIRTSDRMNFKRCRRLWGWTSHLRMALQIKEQPDYFWFGSGMHYALEDYHGPNVYGHPGKAFLAYTEATRKLNVAPSNWNELLPLGLGMMSYYSDYWLKTRDPFVTMSLEGRPQVEINGYIDLRVKHKGKRVVYGFTIDRMLMNEHGQIFVAEYKSAKAFRLYHYDTDEQVTAYCACANRLYGVPISGTYYYQYRKMLPQLPRILSSGSISTDIRQPTTAALYRKGLADVYGTSAKLWPSPNIKCLNELTVEETEDQDRFIRRELIERNQTQCDQFWDRVHMELEDLMNDDLPLYPNQTKDCSWSCPLQVACIAMESGADYEDALSSYATHPQVVDTAWRKHLPKAKGLVLPEEALLYQGVMEEISAQQVKGEWEPAISPEQAFLEEYVT